MSNLGLYHIPTAWQPMSRYSADGWRIADHVMPFDDGTDIHDGFIRTVGGKRTAVLVLRDPVYGYQAWRHDISEMDGPITFQVMRDSLTAQHRDEAYRIFIDRVGDDAQRSALEAGVLPEEDGWKLIRDSIFSNLESSHRRYKNIRWGDVEGAKAPSDIMFTSGDLLTKSFSLRVAVERAAVALLGSTVLPRWHRASINGNVSIERFSIRVSVPFHGKTLTREYELPDGVVHECDLGL